MFHVTQLVAAKININDRNCDLHMSGYHGDTLITIKAEAKPLGQQPLSLIFMSPLYNVL